MLGKLLANVISKRLPPKRKPDFLIGPDKNDPYMKRWWIIPRNKFFNIYLHNMLHDDDDRAAHDHPWWSLSLCLDGHIRERQLVGKGEDGHQYFQINEINKGDWKWRSSSYAHILQLPKGPAWTLFITGPKMFEWGFHCPKGWIPWREFVDPTDPGKPGRGCGED